MIEISQKRKNIIDRITQDLDNIHENGFKHQIMAAVVYKNRIISKASNQKKTHTFQNKFAKNEHAIYLHAETFAIKKALGILGEEKLKKCELIVVRFSKTMNPEGTKIVKKHLANSQPCPGCQDCINHFGIKRVTHSIEGGFSTTH